MGNRSCQIVVLGAGYAGLLATVRLAGRVKREIERGEVAITLVNAADQFVERLRLHQFAANQVFAPRPIGPILRGTGVSFLRGAATHIDLPRRVVSINTGTGVQPVGYDHLVYALGSTIEREGIPGVREHAYVLTPDGPRSAAALRQVLPALNARGRGGRLLVCGGGATGIEAAAEFAESFPNVQVQLATRDEFGGFMPKPVAAYMRKALTRLGVVIQDHTTIAAMEADRAVTASGDGLPYDVCLWTGGFTVPHLARAAGLAVDARGQVLIDPWMRSISHPEVYAIGDAAQPAPPTHLRVRMSAYAAVLMGAHGADCVAAAIQGRTPKPFDFAYAGQAIALGRQDAIGFNTYPDDRAHAPFFRGRVGWRVREFFVRLLADLPNWERRRPGLTFWLPMPRRAARAVPRESRMEGTPFLEDR